MNTSKELAELLNIEPHEPTICVRVVPSTLSDLSLIELRAVTRPVGTTSDCLRAWLRKAVMDELARRTTPDSELDECAAWLLPWHQWDDEQLASSLVTAFSWYDVATEHGTAVVLREVHRAVVAACATRLGELHEAIQMAQKRG